MKKLTYVFFALALIVAGFTFSALNANAQTGKQKPGVVYDANITRVIDGDTVAFEAAFLPDHGLHQRGRQSIVLGDSSDLRIETIFITRQPEPEDGSTADQEQQDDRPPFQGLVRPDDSH